MRSICVFCGSRTGSNSQYEKVTRQLATELVDNSLTLIYGAGDIGLMGILAEQVLSKGGRVIGIIPNHLCKKEIVHNGLTELVVTENMLERKQLMMTRADGFIALPGGLGTLDEILEVATWKQLGQISKPLCLINSDGFYDPFISFIQNLVDAGFMDQTQLELLPLMETPEQAIRFLLSSTG
ncbi:MAG TPA: TIGR00730 family Rossman fold protein [Crenotrichaceae bacterium]|nr:TIGR00730 family Rossman fold protein [Crenotrichaceae bacterium]